MTAIFEAWHFGDGNYPPLVKGQLVNLSFEVEPDVLSKFSSPKDGKFEQIKDAEYGFEGTVLKIYHDAPGSPLVIVQAGHFKFYMNSFMKEMPAFKEGDSCLGSGRLLLDRYIWVENRHEYRESPSLLYPLRVSKIRSVKIPDNLISRSGQGSSGPTSLSEGSTRRVTRSSLNTWENRTGTGSSI